MPTDTNRTQTSSTAPAPYDRAADARREHYSVTTFTAIPSAAALPKPLYFGCKV